jgi:hypothetical protein
VHALALRSASLHTSRMRIIPGFRLTEESGSSTAPAHENRKRSRNDQDVTSTCMELFAQHEQIAATFRTAENHEMHEREDGHGAVPNVNIT